MELKFNKFQVDKKAGNLDPQKFRNSSKFSNDSKEDDQENNFTYRPKHRVTYISKRNSVFSSTLNDQTTTTKAIKTSQKMRRSSRTLMPEELEGIDCPDYAPEIEEVYINRIENRKTIQVKKFRNSIYSSNRIKTEVTNYNYDSNHIDDQQTKKIFDEIGDYDEVVLKIKSCETMKTLISSVYQICNSIIKYTFLQIAICYATLGLVSGGLFTILIAFMSIFSVYMQLEAHKATGDTSYTTFALRWWGMKGKVLIMFLNIVYSLGSCLSYISKLLI